MSNRLANETSPYLLQHKDNPVDWHAWGEEAFLIAEKENKPVFLSVGYSSCHWCHVMAHESFEDEEIAEVLNKYFVCVKLDREERPDVDETFMTATQLATGHGGWPLSVFMTTDKKPFYTGTYFPKEHRGDYPGFRSVVTSLGQAWENQRDEIERSASEFVAGLSQAISQDAGPLTPDLNLELIDQAIIKAHEDFDFEHGGFGEKPKFPPHAAMKFLIEYAANRHALPGEQAHINSLCEQAGHMGLMTLEEMALGGIHDHVGGGFHRYSTDEEWRLPHFEKMLTDNALLLGMYVTGAESTGDPRLKSLFGITADRIVAWIEDEMVGQDGLFMSAMDADTDGEEGLYYTWTVQEINDALGDRAETFCQVFDIVEDGNFADEATGVKTGRNVLRLDQDVENAFEADMCVLREARAGRAKPMTDDKAICAANGLAISSLSRSEKTELATPAAQRWVDEFEKLGHLPHHITKGIPSGLGFLDDYAFMANGILDLHEKDSSDKWRTAAEKMCDVMCEWFRDESGLFRSTGSKHEQLFGRMTPVLDQAVPSAVAEAARLLARLGRTDESRKTMLACLGWMQRMTSSTQSLLLLALEDFIAFPDADRSLKNVPQSEVTVSLEPREVTVDEEGWGHSELVFQIPAGSHINSTEPAAKFLTPTTVRVEGVFGEAGFPAAENEQYTGELRIGLRLRPKAGTEEFEIHVRFQSCTETECQMPQERTLAGVVIVP